MSDPPLTHPLLALAAPLKLTTSVHRTGGGMDRALEKAQRIWRKATISNSSPKWIQPFQEWGASVSNSRPFRCRIVTGVFFGKISGTPPSQSTQGPYFLSRISFVTRFPLVSVVESAILSHAVRVAPTAWQLLMVP